MRARQARAPVKPAANAGLTLFVAPDSLGSDWAQLVLCEKDVDGAVVTTIAPGKPNEDFLVLNPAQTLPTVSDREGVIAGAHVIAEYLDERYPAPPLMPLSPAARARVRMALTRLEGELFPLAAKLGDARAAERSRDALLAALDAGQRHFPTRGWFCGADYCLADTAWAVLLRYLHLRGIDLSKSAQPLKGYAERLFARPAFQRAFVHARPGARAGTRR